MVILNGFALATGIPGYPLLNLYHDYAVGMCAHF